MQLNIQVDYNKNNTSLGIFLEILRSITSGYNDYMYFCHINYNPQPSIGFNKLSFFQCTIALILSLQTFKHTETWMHANIPPDIPNKYAKHKP